MNLRLRRKRRFARKMNGVMNASNLAAHTTPTFLAHFLYNVKNCIVSIISRTMDVDPKVYICQRTIYYNERRLRIVT